MHKQFYHKGMQPQLSGYKPVTSNTHTYMFNPLSPNSVQDQFSPYNYPYTVKR